MKIFVLTETDSSDVSYVHVEAFTKKEDACARLKDLYHQNVIEGDIDSFVNTSLSEDFLSAGFESQDDVAIHWNVKEVELVG